MLNWRLIRNPYNWAIILLMVLIAGVAADIVLQTSGVRPGNSGAS